MTVKFSVRVQDYYAALGLNIWTIVRDGVHIATYTTAGRRLADSVNGRLSFEGPNARHGFFASSGHCEEADGYLAQAIVNRYRAELKLPPLPLPASNGQADSETVRLLEACFEGATVTKLASGFRLA